jgi:hypothetical protein
MSKFLKNYKLLYEDIKNVFKLYNREKKLELENFPMKNKKEVILLYRHMIKTIPPMNKSLLEQRYTYEMIKFYFHEGGRETNYERICLLKNTCYIIIEKINKGVYPPFPKYIS